MEANIIEGLIKKYDYFSRKIKFDLNKYHISEAFEEGSFIRLIVHKKSNLNRPRKHIRVFNIKQNRDRLLKCENSKTFYLFAHLNIPVLFKKNLLDIRLIDKELHPHLIDCIGNKLNNCFNYIHLHDHDGFVFYCIYKKEEPYCLIQLDPGNEGKIVSEMLAKGNNPVGLKYVNDIYDLLKQVTKTRDHKYLNILDHVCGLKKLFLNEPDYLKYLQDKKINSELLDIHFKNEEPPKVPELPPIIPPPGFENLSILNQLEYLKNALSNLGNTRIESNGQMIPIRTASLEIGRAAARANETIAIAQGIKDSIKSEPIDKSFIDDLAEKYFRIPRSFFNTSPSETILQKLFNSIKRFITKFKKPKHIILNDPKMVAYRTNAEIEAFPGEDRYCPRLPDQQTMEKIEESSSWTFNDPEKTGWSENDDGE